MEPGTASYAIIGAEVGARVPGFVARLLLSADSLQPALDLVAQSLGGLGFFPRRRLSAEITAYLAERGAAASGGGPAGLPGSMLQVVEELLRRGWLVTPETFGSSWSGWARSRRHPPSPRWG